MKNLRETLLYEKLKYKRVKCNICPFKCIVKEGKSGICKTRRNINGQLFSTIYGVISSINNDSVEKKPLYHVAPGSRTLSLGSYGCNFNCPGCQNWSISQVDASDEKQDKTCCLPDNVIMLLEQNKSSGLSFTYNEPGIWLEYVLDCFKLAKENNYYTALVTNGFITTESLSLLSGFLDAFRVDIKGFSNLTYKKMTSYPVLKPVLEAALYVKNRLGVHIECVTNIVPQVNDDTSELTQLARWIREFLGECTPWHLTAFSPCNRLSGLTFTCSGFLEKVFMIGKNEGLKYIYLGNIGPNHHTGTYCHHCGKMIIKRTGFNISQYNITKGKCNFCNTVIPGIRM